MKTQIQKTQAQKSLDSTRPTAKELVDAVPQSANGLMTGVHCAECKRALVPVFSSVGKLLLQHVKSDCSQGGKHFEAPSVNLKELK